MNSFLQDTFRVDFYQITQPSAWAIHGPVMTILGCWLQEAQTANRDFSNCSDTQPSKLIIEQSLPNAVDMCAV